MQEEIVVSILCITYNQKEYLKSALDGCVHQETDFAFEIIVHDDASTDGTTEIIKEYAEKYPALIRPLYEEENQYSKGNSIANIMFPYIRGRYVAFCEGDDYWCDAHKLQKQVNVMREHSSAVACVHNAWKWDCCYQHRTKFSSKKEDGFLTTEDIIHWDEKGYATASLLVKKEWLIVPREFQVDGAGDYPRAIYMALHGRIYYLEECMSVYRCNAIGSWTNTIATDILRYRAYIHNVNRMLQYVDRYSTGRYHAAISEKQYLNAYWLVYREILIGSHRKDYLDVWRSLTVSDRFKVYVLACVRPVIDRCRAYRRCLLDRKDTT